MKPESSSQKLSSYRSILDLPDELLTPILEEQPSILEFQLACRAFRQRAIALPTLWTHLSSSRNPQMALERSRDYVLYIDLQIDWNMLPSDIERFDTFLRLIEPHYARWRTFNFLDQYLGCPEHAKAIEDLMGRLHGKVFGQLKELGMMYIRELPRNHHHLLTDQNLTPTIPKCSIWRTPVLDRLEMNQYVPLRLWDCSLSHIVFHSCPLFRDKNITSWASWDFSTSLLGSSKRLRSLELHLTETNFTQTGSEYRVTLPYLKSLDIRITGFCSTWVLTSFSAPRLQSMTLGIYNQYAPITRDQPIAPITTALFPPDKCRFPRLEDLELDLDMGRSGFGSEPAIGLERLLKSLPKLSFLRLSTDTVEVRGTLKLAESECVRSESVFPPLNYLYLVSCHRLDIAFILGLEDVFKASTFELLIISDCDLDEGEVRRAFPADKPQALVFE